MTIFLSQKELDFFNHITEELVEDVALQNAIIYRVHPEMSDYDELYQESTVKAFYPGFQVKALINYIAPEVTTEAIGVTQRRNIELYIHRKFLTDKTLHFEMGDFVYWDEQYFEIKKLSEPQLIQGQPDYSHQIRVEAISAGVSELTIVERPT